MAIQNIPTPTSVNPSKTYRLSVSVKQDLWKSLSEHIGLLIGPCQIHILQPPSSVTLSHPMVYHIEMFGFWRWTGFWIIESAAVESL